MSSSFVAVIKVEAILFSRLSAVGVVSGGVVSGGVVSGGVVSGGVVSGGVVSSGNVNEPLMILVPSPSTRVILPLPTVTIISEPLLLLTDE